MPFVISAGVNITGFGTGFQSVNLSLTPNIQRLYELGQTLPFDKNITRQTTATINKYSGQGTTYDVQAQNAANCLEENYLTIGITAANCGGSVVDVQDDYWIQGYSYSKDIQGWGIESYTLITRPEVIGGDGATVRMLRGTAEGQTTTDGGAETGIVFAASPTVDGQTIEVTAGNPGIGRANNVIFGEVITVGGGTGKADGRDGNGNVTIPYAPIYIPT